MVQVELSKIIIDEKRQDQIIVLKEKNGERQFPIVIGFLEASSIKMKLSNVETPRPLTHDLVLLAIESLGAKVEQVVIDKLVNSTFHAKIVVKTSDHQLKNIDARPSDGVAIAVRAGVPIFVDEEILNKASIFNPTE